MHKIYAQIPDSKHLILSEEESRHLCKVMRKKVGDYVLILDGKGNKFTGKILVADSRFAEIELLDVENTLERSDVYIVMGIAPTKNISRIEFFVEKATEIGVDEIHPIICTNSERKVLRTDRLEKIAIAAMKQSGQFFLPKIAPISTFENFTKTHPAGFIAYCPQHETNSPLLKHIKKQKTITILIGPEGDFTAQEVNFALENGYSKISLGKSILRTETAGIYACSLINALI